MTEPIALAAPDGTVYAYACGHCRHAFVVGERMCDYDDRLVAERASESMAVAKRCCSCSKCGTLNPQYGRANDLKETVQRLILRHLCAACWEGGERQAYERRMAEIDAANAREAAAYKESLAKALDIPAAHQLEQRMSDWSEDNYCAGWLSDLEYTLWREDYPELKALAGRAGGWWKHRQFVPMAEWLIEYERHRSETVK